MERAQAAKIVEAVVENLTDRKGFDDWWDELGEAMQHEISADLVDVVRLAAS